MNDFSSPSSVGVFTVFVEGRDFGIFFGLHASILEPDLDLPLSEPQHVRDLDPSPSRQVAVELELLLELQRLESRVRLASSFGGRRDV